MKSSFCTECGAKLFENDSFCRNCGRKVNDIETVPETKTETSVVSKKSIVNVSNFDPIFNNSEDILLEEFIKKEMEKAGVVDDKKLLPAVALKRKNILSIIFAVLVFVYVTLIFFHFPFFTYLLGLIILVVFFFVTRNYDLIKYLKKEIKSRPSEKISNIVMNVKNSFIADKLKPIRISGVVVAAIIPLFIFLNPRIIYEKVDGGYAVRYYIFGLTNFTSVKIPETYKGEKVVSLRGNTFSNMPFLKEVKLPDTITEIRGQAFKNDKKLVSVNIPENLEYLGGGAFYNCKSIRSIELPNTLTYLGGEAFSNAKSLISVKLSDSLTEIRGNTFENCTSLTSIDIPDSVTRIGSHAFYGAESLSKVNISRKSKLAEIGSSAFRRCYSLYTIEIPSFTIMNERTFKESPTYVNRFTSYYNSNY